jgi:hypothetical protein
MLGAILTATILFAQAAPETTPPAAAAPPPAGSVSPLTVTGKKAEAEKEVVCHSEPVLGSLFPKKVCATRQALAERTREDQERVREWTALRPYKTN